MGMGAPSGSCYEKRIAKGQGGVSAAEAGAVEQVVGRSKKANVFEKGEKVVSNVFASTGKTLAESDFLADIDTFSESDFDIVFPEQHELFTGEALVDDAAAPLSPSAFEASEGLARGVAGSYSSPSLAASEDYVMVPARVDKPEDGAKAKVLDAQSLTSLQTATLPTTTLPTPTDTEDQVRTQQGVFGL